MTKMFHRAVASALIALPVALAHAEHPQVLVTPQDREAVQKKIDQTEWGASTVETLRKRVDPYLAKVEQDEQYLTSRLAMNWETRYTRDLTADSRWIGGEGQAPVPTPRFAGARNWSTEWSRPASIDDYKPFNDQNGKVWLINNETGEGAWVDPGVTGHTLERVNQDVMQIAADAGFLYWLTDDERYAKLAADLLWTYMEGFSHKEPPVVTDSATSKSGNIIGMTSFEVIHENIVIPLALAYDFTHDYLEKHEKYDVELIQQQFKRMIDRVVENGGNKGNWNLHQARIIAYGGMVLKDDAAYEDGQGRQHYVDIVLNADLPSQMGITDAVATIDEATGVWPESPGYAFGTLKDLVHLASLVGETEAGKKFLTNPRLTRGVFAQCQQLHPSGVSNGIGDTSNTTINCEALELLIAAARERGDEELETTLTAILRREIDAGRYDRNKLRDLFAVTKFVAELKEVDGEVSTMTPTFYATPLNVLMLRVGEKDPKTALSAALYGTKGGHMHSNGVAIELYGAGFPLGSDSGTGSSYWNADHIEYYRQPPAHNTVIVNGQSNYASSGDGQRQMELLAVEPKPEQPAQSDAIRFATAGFTYQNPVAAEQQRTLALVQLDDGAGFYLDVFRSRATGNSAGEGEFHDYLYHNLGQELIAGTSLSPTSQLQDENLLDGYGWFKNERSATVEDVEVTFTLNHDDLKPTMSLHMPGSTQRTLFAVDAPACRAVRHGELHHLIDIPMPTVLVRQEGPAWEQPFVAVYEPFEATDRDAAVKSVEHEVLGDTVVVTVTGATEEGEFRVVAFQDADGEGETEHEGLTFEGRFGLAVFAGDELKRLYLGEGTRLAFDSHELTEVGEWTAD